MYSNTGVIDTKNVSFSKPLNTKAIIFHVDLPLKFRCVQVSFLLNRFSRKHNSQYFPHLLYIFSTSRNDPQTFTLLYRTYITVLSALSCSTKKIYCIQCQRKLCSWILYVWIGIFVIGCFTAVVVVSVLVVGPYR